MTNMLTFPAPDLDLHSTTPEGSYIDSLNAELVILGEQIKEACQRDIRADPNDLYRLLQEATLIVLPFAANDEITQ